MNILFIEPCYENFGGYFRAIGLAKGLSHQNINVTLLCPHKGKSFFGLKKTVIQNHLTRLELPYFEFSFFINGRLLRGIISSFFVIFGHFEVIHFFATMQIESIIPFIVAKALRKRIVFDWDDYWQDAPIYHQSGNLVKKYLTFTENTIPKYVSFMTVTSDFLMKKAQDLGCPNVLKIINGVDQKQFVPLDKITSRKNLKVLPNNKMVLSFGNTFAGDRANLLLETFKKINDLDPTVKLYLNLDPRLLPVDKNKYKDIIEKIKVTGYLNFNDKKALSFLGAADLIIFLMGKSDAEKSCFPVRIGTYLNAGKVIATNHEDTEVWRCLKSNNCALIGKSTTDLAAIIIDFFHNKELQKQLERNVLLARENLKWDNLVIPLINFYQKQILIF